MIKERYEDAEEVRKLFQFQRSPDMCWPVSIWNILNEFWKREMKEIMKRDTPLNLKEIRRCIYGKGPYGTFQFKNYCEIINQKISGKGIVLEERIDTPSMLPLEVTPRDMVVDVDLLHQITKNPDCSFPIITVDNRWFGHFGLKGWDDPDMTHVIIIIDRDRRRDLIHFFDPARKFFERSSKGLEVPKYINTDQLMSFWETENNYPRWISWFRKKDMSLEAWMR
ncbi:MAG TPA: hypothetical protein ENK47_06725 [Euryarchaeota archaeon]|nr:hypothetical protein [Euryarchaeota archaeon]